MRTPSLTELTSDAESRRFDVVTALWEFAPLPVVASSPARRRAGARPAFDCTRAPPITKQQHRRP